MPYVIDLLAYAIFYCLIAINVAIRSREYENGKFHGEDPPSVYGKMMQYERDVFLI